MGFSWIGITALALAVFSLGYACSLPSGPTVEQVQTAEYFRAMGEAANYYLEEVRPSILRFPEIGSGQTDYRLRNQEEAAAIERIVPKLRSVVEMMKKAVPPPKLQEHHTVNIEGMETQISICHGIIEALRQSDAEAFRAAKKTLDEFTVLSIEQNQLALRKAGFNSIEDVKAALKIHQEHTTSRIVGWVFFATLVCFAVRWTFGCYSYIKRGVGVSYATINTTVIWWVLLGWTFHYSDMNRLHLLWLAPAAVPLSSFVTISRALSKIEPKGMGPPGLLLLLAVYIAALWWLTPQG